MRDRYGNSVTTASSAAHTAYCEGVDLFLAAQSGGIQALQNAVELDPEFALAHADLARILQIHAQPVMAKQHIQRAVECSQSLERQELAHVQIMQLLLAGKSAEAFTKIKQHISQHPRDVLTVAPCCGVFGLIGFSGKLGREQDNADFMATLHQHYEGDWWFESQYAFALAEIGALSEAETLNELAFAQNPRNANAAHHRAHIHYELGEFAAGRQALAQWRADYDRDAILHCHLAWHDALWALSEGRYDQLWDIVAADVMPDVAQAPPLNVMTDLVALLIRVQLAGETVPTDLWQVASDYAQQSFPRAGISFADAHSAAVYALNGDAERLAGLLESPRGTAFDQVQRLGAAFMAFADQDWASCTAQLAPVMTSHERLGGSRAQRDLLELTYAFSLDQLGQAPESARLILGMGSK